MAPQEGLEDKPASLGREAVTCMASCVLSAALGRSKAGVSQCAGLVQSCEVLSLTRTIVAASA